MQIKKMVLGGLGNNTFVVIGDDQKTTLLIDPAYEPERIMEFLTGQGLELKAILVTHGHFDHIGAIDKIVEHNPVPVYAHEVEAKLMNDPIKNLSTYFTSREVMATATDFLADKDHLDFGQGLVFKTIVVPGHSPKSICFYNVEENCIFTGDTLFSGSLGRTDYYNGDAQDLVQNIKERLMFLPASTKVYPGHGPSTTIGNEKSYNPFLQ